MIVETASVLATPDAAELQAVVQRRARPVRSRGAAPTERVRALIAAVQEIGVPTENMRTNVFETYSDRERGRRARRQRVRVPRVDGPRQARAVVAALAAADAGRPGRHRLRPDGGTRRRGGDRPSAPGARGRRDAALGLRLLRIRKVDLSLEFGYDSDSFDAASRGSRSPRTPAAGRRPRSRRHPPRRRRRDLRDRSVDRGR